MEEDKKSQILQQIKAELDSIDFHTYDVELKQSEIIKNLSISYKILTSETTKK